MRKRKYLFVLLTVPILLGLTIFIKVINTQIEPSRLATEETVSLEAVAQIMFDEFGENDFTCTGLTYDYTDESFWIADYGTDVSKKNKPRLVEIDSSFNKVSNIIELDKYFEETFNLQGISYDVKDDSLWIATGESILELDKKGKIINSFSNRLFKKYMANGIAVKGEEIWVLCYEKYLLKFDRDGNEINRYDFNFSDQDQIYTYNGMIYCTVGADYKGNNNYIFEFNPKTEEVKNIARINNSNSIEGIVIVDKNIFIANDGKFHDDVLGKSYITKYDLSF